MRWVIRRRGGEDEEGGRKDEERERRKVKGEGVKKVWKMKKEKEKQREESERRMNERTDWQPCLMASLSKQQKKDEKKSFLSLLFWPFCVQKKNMSRPLHIVSLSVSHCCHPVTDHENVVQLLLSLPHPSCLLLNAPLLCLLPIAFSTVRLFLFPTFFSPSCTPVYTSYPLSAPLKTLSVHPHPPIHSLCAPLSPLRK